MTRRRLPRTVAVGLTIVPGGDPTAATVTDVFRRVQAEVPDVRARLGIKAIRLKRATTGDLLLEIPGAEAPRKADDLAALLREHIEEGEGVRITRPVRRVDLRISELEDTISPADIARAVSEFGAGFCADDIRVGRIRRGRDGLGTAWVQAPAVVGVPAAEAKNDTYRMDGRACDPAQGQANTLFQVPCPRPRAAALSQGQIALLLQLWRRGAFRSNVSRTTALCGVRGERQGSLSPNGYTGCMPNGKTTVAAHTPTCPRD